MTKHQEISSSKNTTPYQDHLYREINSTIGAAQSLTICISQTRTKFFQRLHQNWLTVQLSFKDLFGKIMLVYSLSKRANPSLW
jgi:hypothetical protein